MKELISIYSRVYSFSCKRPHAYGAVLTLIGISAILFVVLILIQSGRNHSTEVWIIKTGVYFGSGNLIMGVPSLIFGSKYWQMLSRKKLGFYIFILAVVIYGIFGSFALRTFLAMRGYISP